MSNRGYVRMYRKTLENPIICKDGDHIAVWTYLLLKATHQDIDIIFRDERIVLKPGQLLTGRKSISEKLNISESKVQRILKLFKSEHQIEQQASNKNRLITILNWELYQNSEHQSEQQVNNKRTTSEQQVNTNNNIRTKEHKKKKEYIVEYLNSVCSTRFKSTSKATQSHINARLDEGYTVEDFKAVIDKKFNEWGNDEKMSQFLRPQTLFGTKFESYLNQKEVKSKYDVPDYMQPSKKNSDKYEVVEESEEERQKLLNKLRNNKE